jgi:hypothetical protein
MLTKIYRTWPYQGTRLVLKFWGASMIHNAKSLCIAVNASLRRLNNSYLLIFVTPANYKWSVVNFASQVLR